MVSVEDKSFLAKQDQEAIANMMKELNQENETVEQVTTPLHPIVTEPRRSNRFKVNE